MALVADVDDHVIGIAVLEDLREELIGGFEDGTDQPDRSVDRP